MAQLQRGTVRTCNCTRSLRKRIDSSSMSRFASVWATDCRSSGRCYGQWQPAQRFWSDASQLFCQATKFRRRGPSGAIERGPAKPLGGGPTQKYHTNGRMLASQCWRLPSGLIDPIISNVSSLLTPEITEKKRRLPSCSPSHATPTVIPSPMSASLTSRATPSRSITW